MEWKAEGPRRPQSLLAPLVGLWVSLATASAAAQEDVDRCFVAQLTGVDRCAVEVLETGGFFCPSDAEIRDRICQRLEEKVGQVVDVLCEGPGRCVDVDRATGTVVRTFTLQRERFSCNVRFEMAVEVTVAGTAYIGRCQRTAESR